MSIIKAADIMLSAALIFETDIRTDISIAYQPLSAL
jgi:hypothetical protein